jgi:DNA-binding CsgD family transcriptional regulator
MPNEKTFSSPHANEPGNAASLVAKLPPRCRDVLDGILCGRSNKVIAHCLKISPRTVEVHRARMMRMLGARHVADAIRLGLEAAHESRDRSALPTYDTTAKAAGPTQGRHGARLHWGGARRTR